MYENRLDNGHSLVRFSHVCSYQTMTKSYPLGRRKEKRANLSSFLTCMHCDLSF